MRSRKDLLQFLAVKAVRVIPRARTGRLIGSFAASPASRKIIGQFIKAFGIDASEAEKEIGHYSTLAEFFTRRLKPGSRPIDEIPGSIVSPVDALLHETGRPSGHTRIDVKGRTLSFAGLLGENEARIFEKGGYSVHYLSPRDYHRIHSPTSGSITAWEHIPGDFLPVFPRALREFGPVFTKNERVNVFMDTRFGKFAVSMVAAMGVGNIGLSFSELKTNTGLDGTRCELKVHKPVTKGGEIGVFNLGSTVIVCWENPGIKVVPDLVGTHVRMGKMFASLEKHS